MQRVWILISGKSYAGKDTVADEFVKHVPGKRASFAVLAKEEFCAQTHLDITRMLCDRDYKERHRKQLIAYAMGKRAVDPDYFVRALEAQLANEPLVIISDYRFPSEADYLRSRENLQVFCVRVVASSESRRERGWIANPSIDDGVSECNLDGGTFDLCVINNGSLEHLREFEICSFAAHFMNRYKTAD